jgi:hypothetical protein
MAQVISHMGGPQRANEHQVFAAYDLAVGPRLRQQTCADNLRGGTLFVRVASSAMAHQITMLKGEILARMAATLPPGKVSDLRTRVGQID